MTRRQVLILCAHEPELDPRIHWIARYGPSGLSRVVLGLADARRPRPAVEEIEGTYTVRRVAREGLSAVAALRQLAAAFWRSAGMPARAALVVVGALAALPLALLWVLAKLARAWLPYRLRAGVARVVPYRLWVFVSMLRHYATANAALVAGAHDLARFDIVHVNDLEALPAGVLIKRASGAKLIYDSHEYWPYSDVESARWEQLLWESAERRLVRHVDAAFSVSEPLCARLSDSYGTRFATLPNCEPNEARYDAIVPGSVNGACVRFLYQGNFAPQRGLEELVSGWAMLADARAQLYLRGPDGPAREECLKLARGLGVEGRTVHFLPPVIENELVTGATQFDVGVIPYKPDAPAYAYCCPNKLSQYMQAGLAVLTNDLVTVRAMVEQYQCGAVYDSHRLDTLRAAVDALTADAARLMQLKRAAKEAARTDFNWQRQSTALYRSYGLAA